jgi:hypothetical protein
MPFFYYSLKVRLIAFSQKNEKFFHFFQKRSKYCFWPILTSDSERTSKLRSDEEFSLSKTYFSKNIQNKNFQFFPKKVKTQKRNFSVIQHHFLFKPTPTVKKLSKNSTPTLKPTNANDDKR